MKKNYLVLSFLFSILCISTTTHADTFAGGDGSVGDPYQIETCTQLQSVDNYLSSNFILNNNINCYDTINWNGGNGFNPIGEYFYQPFTGIFNGQNYTIDDLYIGANYASPGLFAVASGTIQNFGLNNITVAGIGSYTGTLAGTMAGGTISQVFVTGQVTGLTYTGGLIGWHATGTVSNVYTRVTVTADLYSGNIIGRNDASTIINGYATGGASSSVAAGFIGNNFGGTTVNSFYDSQLMGVSDTNGGVTPKTTSQMKSVNTYTATSTTGLTTPWDFVGNPNQDVANSNIWNINPLYNDGYPYFTWQVFDQTAPTITSISSNVTDRTYTKESSIPIVITFSEPVTSTGSIILTLETGNVDETCAFTILYNNTATCNYTVQAGDVSGDLDVRVVSGTIRDRWGNVMTNFVPSVGLAAQKAIVVNGGPLPGSWSGPTSGGGGVDTSYLARIIAQPVVQASTTSTSSQTFSFTRDLRMGVVDADVKLLQQYLNIQGFIVATSGPGSIGNETTRFGGATRTALMRLQKTARIPATGFFGPITRAKVFEMLKVR